MATQVNESAWTGIWLTQILGIFAEYPFLVIKPSFCLKQIPLASSYPSKKRFIFSSERRPFPEIEAENLGLPAYARQKWSPRALPLESRNSKPSVASHSSSLPVCPPLLPHHSPSSLHCHFSFSYTLRLSEPRSPAPGAPAAEPRLRRKPPLAHSSLRRWARWRRCSLRFYYHPKCNSSTTSTLAGVLGAVFLPWMVGSVTFHRSEELLRYRAVGRLLRRPEVRLPCVICSELLFAVSSVVLGFSFIGKISIRVILSSDLVWPSTSWDLAWGASVGGFGASFHCVLLSWSRVRRLPWLCPTVDSFLVLIVPLLVGDLYLGQDLTWIFLIFLTSALTAIFGYTVMQEQEPRIRWWKGDLLQGFCSSCWYIFSHVIMTGIQ
jgi:hypothetical protein